jgi:DNA polymerase III epsilon subunit-like protein
LIQDTQDLYCGWSEPSIKQINLGKACEALGIQTGKLHNAGNDALATLQVWEKLLNPDARHQEHLQPESMQTLEEGIQNVKLAAEPRISKPVQPVNHQVEVDLIEL